MKKAVILLSGGLDSTTTLAVAKSRGFEVFALTINYHQKHSVELDAAKRVAHSYGVVEHLIVELDLSAIGGSVLTGDLNAKSRFDCKSGIRIPPTYVPARNTIFLSLGAAFAEARCASHIFIGVSSVDYSGYPDCRREFIESFEKTINLGTREGIAGRGLKIETPIINLSKAETILLGAKLGVDYSLTHSCYDPPSEQISCGVCESCRLRMQGFVENGLEDPLTYAVDIDSV